jgi:exodeoxyribonuclease III
VALRIATWNVNSIRARRERVLAWLEARRPDVLCMQETKVKDPDFPAAEFDALGYRLTLWGQSPYNGVAILSRGPAGDVARGFGDGGDDTQARFLAATVAGVRVLSAYVPNGQELGSPAFLYKLDWLDRLRRSLERTADPAAPLVLCGDLNVAPEDRDVHDPATWEGKVLCHPDERAALARVCDWGLSDAFRLHHAEGGRFSWWDYRQLGFPRNHGLRIDHILVTAPLAGRCTAADIDRDARKGKLPSDHAPVLAEFA